MVCALLNLCKPRSPCPNRRGWPQKLRHRGLRGSRGVTCKVSAECLVQRRCSVNGGSHGCCRCHEPMRPVRLPLLPEPRGLCSSSAPLFPPREGLRESWLLSPAAVALFLGHAPPSPQATSLMQATCCPVPKTTSPTGPGPALPPAPCGHPAPAASPGHRCSPARGSVA